tara:strand:+ start:1668 stop:2588 length:921 start_codon:yes stop_codon:yes gene_type:complete
MTDSQPHALIIGAGAIGSFYGAILKRAGCTVSAVVRSEYDAVKENGFQFESPLGDISWAPDYLYKDGDTPDAVPDYVILATKVLPDSDRVALVKPWVGEGTRIVLIQNGLDIERELADAYPNNPVISCLAFVAVSRQGPGRIKHNAYGRLVMGRFPQGADAHCEALRDLFVAGGIDIKLADDVVRERWLKCVWNTPFNPLSVLANGADTLTMLDAPGGEKLVRELMDEVMATAAADGYPLPPQLPDSNIEGTRKMPAYKNSMALDYLNGRAIELDAILGNVVAIAQKHGVAVPRLETMLAALRMRA